MGSISARQSAKDVLESVGKGKRPILRNILKKNGYAQNTADSPKQVTNTKSYREVINPIVEAMQKERDAIMARLPKVRSKAKYRDLIDGADKMTKNIQLLTGGETERKGISINFDKAFDE
jgi:hypothetical protein